MALTQFYIYEQQNQIPVPVEYMHQGWFDDQGLTLSGWFDQDIANTVVPLNQFEAPFFDDPDTFFAGPDGPVSLPGGRPTLPAQWQPHVTVEVLPTFFDDPDLFFMPMSIRALFGPDQLLRNEVRRIR
jgi:hypothetical protein